MNPIHAFLTVNGHAVQASALLCCYCCQAQYMRSCYEDDWPVQSCCRPPPRDTRNSKYTEYAMRNIGQQRSPFSAGDCLLILRVWLMIAQQWLRWESQLYLIMWLQGRKSCQCSHCSCPWTEQAVHTISLCAFSIQLMRTIPIYSEHQMPLLSEA